jgi:hypothetical protein
MADKTNKAPAIHIAPEHQSAPKKHWADTEVEKAAEEIRQGQFRPDLSDDADLIGMVGLVRGTALKNPDLLTNEEKMGTMRDVADSLALAQHPRVQEALARMEEEKRTARTTQEALEKAQMLHEYNALVAQKNMWDGQGRWVGKENEEMRMVNILSWKQWLSRLEETIGEGRVFVNRYAILGRQAVLVPNTSYMRDVLAWKPDDKAGAPAEYLPVATIQPVSPEWMVMRFNEYGEPTTARYLGWRTALLCLIKKRIISEKEAHRAFPLGDGPAGDWYREQLYEIRARDGVVN